MVSSSQFKSPQLLQPDDLIALIREIQAMIAAGVPIGMGLSEAAHGFSAQLEQVSGRLAARLQQGETISEACRHEPALPPELRAILLAGFRCGNSEQVLDDVVKMTEAQLSLKRALRVGLVYPVTILISAIILSGIILTGLFPLLISIYQDIHSELPWWLSWANRAGNATFSNGVFVALFAISICLFMLMAFRGVLLLPGLNRVQRDFELCQFADLLSLLVGYGIPLPESLRLTGEAVRGTTIRQECFSLAEAVESGQGIAVAISTQTEFPDFLSWLIVTGHHDSQLPRALKEAARFYQNRANSRALWICRFVPAAAVILLGGGITFLYVISVFGPMSDLWIQLGQHSEQFQGGGR